MQRCFNPRNPKYADYGGRGITMCPEWRDNFRAFLAYLGTRPKGLTLDRIHNDGNYEPGNVQWATPARQGRNRHNVIKFRDLDDELLSLRSVAHALAVDSKGLKELFLRNGVLAYVD